MNQYVIPAILAAIGFIVFGIYRVKMDGMGSKSSWMVPAALSVVFFIYSLYAVTTEGATGFWVEHTRNAWGNQIWFDLLLGIGVGWFLIVPQAKAVGMRLWFWFLLILSSGSIGFLAMLARLLYLRARV